MQQTKAAVRRLEKRVQDEIDAFVQLAWSVIQSENWNYTDIRKCGGPTPQTTSRLMNGETKSPHFATLVKIGVALRLQVNWNHARKNILQLQRAA